MIFHRDPVNFFLNIVISVKWKFCYKFLIVVEEIHEGIWIFDVIEYRQNGMEKWFKKLFWKNICSNMISEVTNYFYLYSMNNEIIWENSFCMYISISKFFKNIL